MESKRACCSSSVCCGIPVEKGCLIFSIINAVMCSLGTLGSVGFLIYDINLLYSTESRSPNDMALMYVVVAIAVACVVCSAIALTFAGVLCAGLHKNNKRYIMAYLVYGIITVILSVLATFGFIGLMWGEVIRMVYALIPLLVCGKGRRKTRHRKSKARLCEPNKRKSWPRVVSGSQRAVREREVENTHPTGG